MLFLTTQPDSDYYIWQVQVQINNFKKFGCDDKMIIVFGYNPILGINPRAIEINENSDAKILFYPDTRDLSTKLYLPTIRAHLLKKLYRENPEILFNKNYLYLDCDILFTKYPNFGFLNNEKFVHVSDTTTQLSFDTLKSKNPILFKEMCRSVGITEYVVNKNKKSGGGIVFHFKTFNYFNYDFWDKVEKDSSSLYKMMLVSADKFRSIELVTANKWALLWNLWLIGYDTKISDELSVTWATNHIEDWKTNNLYNNAGVSEKNSDFLFYKSDYVDRCPFDADLSYVSDEYCSYKYVQEIIETREVLNLRK